MNTKPTLLAPPDWANLYSLSKQVTTVLCSPAVSSYSFLASLDLPLY